jgi:hypothetical protein
VETAVNADPPPKLDLRALARLDESIVSHIHANRGLGRIGAWAAAVTLLGGAIYGFAFGLWRAPEQALYSAIKLPLLLFAVVAASALINGVLALLLRSGIGVLQGAVSIMLSFSVAVLMLAGLAPVAVFFVLSVPGPEAAAVRPAEVYRTAELVLFFHILAVGACGVAGNVRLYQLLRRLAPTRAIAVRVLISWILVDGFVGSQLSWILRPFLCKPHLPPEFIRERALEGNFFEELWRILGPFFQSVDGWTLLMVSSAAAPFFYIAYILWKTRPTALAPRLVRNDGPYRSSAG